MIHPQQFFPVGLSGYWQDPEQCQLTPSLSAWLLAPGSLTSKLKQHCSNFRVDVLGQKQERLSPLEAGIHLLADQRVIVREVVLYCDDKPHVFARSLLPIKSLTGEQAYLAELGTQPLGQVIFNCADLVRHPIEIAQFDEQSPVVKLANRLTQQQCSMLWGRRSRFDVNGKPIVVAEVFLPDAHAYQQIEEHAKT